MTQTCIGWILDVYIENDQAVLWFKTEYGQVLRLIDNYEPVFYIQPKSEQSGTEILQIFGPRINVALSCYPTILIIAF
jgi:hypothetical protein